MEKTMIIQGREISHKDIELIREMIKIHPSWGRTQLSKELALLWNWRAANGKFMSKILSLEIIIISYESDISKNNH